MLNGDVNECVVLVLNVEYLNFGDLCGDFLFYLVVFWISLKGVELMNVLMLCGVDVNIKNKWG